MFLGTAVEHDKSTSFPSTFILVLYKIDRRKIVTVTFWYKTQWVQSRDRSYRDRSAAKFLDLQFWAIWADLARKNFFNLAKVSYFWKGGVMGKTNKKFYFLYFVVFALKCCSSISVLFSRVQSYEMKYVWLYAPMILCKTFRKWKEFRKVIGRT